MEEKTVFIRCSYEKLMPIDEIKYHPENPNTHTKDQINRLVELILYQGIRHPVIVSNISNYCVAGHGRLEAYKKLGLKEVPCDVQEFEDEDQEYAFMTSDNAIASWAKLDFKLINQSVVNLGPNFNVDMLGLKNFVIEPADKKANENNVPAKPKAARTNPGDLYELGEHRLLCADCTLKQNVDKLMGGGVIADMVFTDPPYGVAYVGKTEESLTIKNDNLGDEGTRQLVRDILLAAPLKEGGSFYICSPAGNTETFFRLAIADAKYSLKQCLVWVKHTFVMGRQDYHWRHESILYGWRPGKSHYFIDDRTQDTVWEYDKPSKNTEHPTMKPVELSKRAIANSSKIGDIVYEPCMGSGSTMIACEQTSRRCFGMEIDPVYADVIVQRFVDFSGDKRIKLNGQEIVWETPDLTTAK